MGIVSEYRIEKQFKHNILSVIFDSDSFFYAISDLNNNLKLAVKYALEENPLTEIPRIIKEETLDQHYYSAVNIFSNSDKFTFVPTEEYNYGQEPVFVRNSFKLEDAHIATDLSPSGQLRIIHAYQKVFQSALSEISSDQNFRHISLAYIEGVHSDGVHIQLNSESINVLIRKEGKFVFFNQFKAGSDEERLYFIMLSFDQLNLNTVETPLFLNGREEDCRNLIHVLSPYIGNFQENSPSFLNTSHSKDLRDLYLASICE